MKYEVLMDGKPICSLEDDTGKLNPVYAIMLMARQLSEERERMMEEDSQPRME